MKLHIDGVGVGISDQMRARAEKKLAKFERYFGDRADIHVKYRPEGDLLTCEITMKVNKHFYRAEALEQQAADALDRAIEHLEDRMRRQKQRLHRSADHYAYLKPYLEDLEETEEQPKIRYKRFPIEAMSDEEAILQMEMLGHSFFVYLNGDTGRTNVLYQRKNGEYGIIEPIY